MFYSKNMVMKTSKITSAAYAKVVRDKTRSATPCGLVRSKRLCAKIYFVDSTRKQRVNVLCKSKWKSWRLTNHSARIIMPGLQNGFWLANLWGRKSLSCIDFFLHKFKQNTVHISIENYFTHRIPNYFWDTCAKKTSNRVKTIVLKSKIKLKKDEVFHYF